METIKTTIFEGVVAEKDGAYYGEVYADGHGDSYGFITISGDKLEIDSALIKSCEYCKNAIDLAYNKYDEEKLRKATLRKVKKTTIYEIEGT
jgi:hypothetical protein